MQSGEVLKVVATDPGSVRDFQAFARQTGNELVEQPTRERRVHPLSCAGAERAERQRQAASSELSVAGTRGSPAPSSGCFSASSTLACRKPSLLPQS